MGQLTNAQANALADQYTQMATTLGAAMQAQAGNPNIDPTDMQQQATDLLNEATGFQNQGVAALFNDSDAAYGSLSSTTIHANAVATSIAAEAAQFSRLAKIAASMLTLAAALGGANPIAVFTAIGGVAAAASGH